MKHVYLLLIVGLLLSLQSSLADTTWVGSGNVSGVWNSTGSPYIIHSGDITVATGETLLINPGVKVYFAGQFKLIVNGLLQAIGTETDSIWFTGDPSDFPADIPTRWRGIRFIDGHENCQLSYCNIKYGGAYGAGEESNGGGIYCYNTDLYIEHSLIDSCHCGKQGVQGRGCGAYIEESTADLEYTNIGNNYPSSEYDHDYYFGGKGTGLSIKNADVTMRHCRVYKNVTAGYASAIYFQAGAIAMLDSCLIDSNSYLEGNVAIIADSTASLTMHGTTIAHNNRWAWGHTGGMKCVGVTLIMDACTLRNNRAVWVEPGPQDGGAGLLVLNPVSASISNTVFDSNVGQYGSALLCNNATVTNCDFIGNESTNGALYSNGGNVVEGCRFTGNLASLETDILSYHGDGVGGGIQFGTGSDTVRNCYFSGNLAILTAFFEDTASHIGGAMHCDTNASPYIVNCIFEGNDLNQFDCFGTGSVLYNDGGHPVLEFCTMQNNPASGGTAQFGYFEPNYQQPGGVIYSNGGSVTLKSCIMSNSTATTGVWFANGATGSIQHSDFYGISGGSFLGTLPLGLGSISTTNANGDACDEFYNIYLDPEFVDVVNGDLHLTNSSPCIGAGDPFSTVGIDYEYNTRPMPVASLRDMGAFESEIAGLLAAVDDLVIQPDYATDDVLLFWTPSAGAVNYEVYVGNAPEYVPGLFTLIGTTASTSYTDTDGLLEAAPQRTYVVRASVLP